MGVVPPKYFQHIRDEAHQQWDLLEAQPKLAGPWHQLFRQVKSPPHVLSELLQNADDAGATEAAASVEDGCFIFQHNGKDFNEGDFDSLCSFGSSNKRHLLTIGFRGVGFRSVFSLGPSVEVITPTLAVRFDESRFTEPVWIDEAALADKTIVRVRLDSKPKSRAIRASIDHWKRGALPLVFFRKLKCLGLDGEEFRSERQIDGPAKRSAFVTLSGFDQPVLVIHSREEAFPDDCLNEIREERSARDFTLPPCAVTIVWTPETTQRLYVVLPTDVVIPLPFSCHGPFVQDPQRSRIKDPSISPTNSWLLGRIGRLLASAMAEWVGRNDLSMNLRARAYDLLPEPLEDVGSALSQRATEIILDAFREEVQRHALVLCQDGSLGRARSDVATVPIAVAGVWSAGQLDRIFDLGGRAVLAPEVSSTAAERLAAWELVEPCTSEVILSRLIDKSKDPPSRPEQLETLLPLWAFLDEQVENDRWRWSSFWDDAAVVPVAGAKRMRPASELFPSRARPAGCTSDEWRLLLSWVRVVDPRWIELLDSISSEDRPAAADVVTIGEVTLTQDQVSRIVHAHIKACLDRTTQLDRVVAEAASYVFANNPPDADAAMHLTRIAARLNVPLPTDDESSVRFLCRDGGWRPMREGLLVSDPSIADLDALFPEKWIAKRAISEEYTRGLPEPDATKLRGWILAADRIGIPAFPIPELTKELVSDRGWIDVLCEQRGGRRIERLPYKDRDGGFTLEDYTWSKSVWSHWATLPNPDLWRAVSWAVARCWSERWEKCLRLAVSQPGMKYIRPVDVGAPRAAWLEKLQGMACLPDEYGNLHLPAELYRRTPETLGLLGVEPFVHEEWDQPGFHPPLDALGVRTQPRGLGSLVERLKALAETDSPPLAALRNLYRAVDRVAARLDAGEASEQLAPFRDFSLLYTVDGWRTADFAFRENPHNLPGVATIHSDMQDLSTLWDRLRIAREPSFQDALQWLTSLPREKALPDAVLEGVRRLLQRYPVDVWTQAGRWLNLQGRLRNIDDFRWCCGDGAAVECLHAAIGSNTADVSLVDSGSLEHLQHVLPPRIETHLRKRPVKVENRRAARPDDQMSLRTLGGVLARLKYVDESDAKRVLADGLNGARLSRTTLYVVDSLDVCIELDATPAGPDSAADVVWDGEEIILCGSPAQAYETLVREIARGFETEDARSAVHACIGRDAEWIEQYARSHLEVESQVDDGERPRQGAADPDGDLHSDRTKAKDRLGPFSDEPEADDDGDFDGGERGARGNSKPSLKMRVTAYYRRNGFESLADGDILRSAAGEVLQASDGVTQFELLSPDGHVRPVWVAPRSLDSNHGIEIPVEVWELGKLECGVLLEPRDGDFVAHSFTELRERVERRELEIGPSRYRVRPAAKQPREPDGGAR